MPTTRGIVATGRAAAMSRWCGMGNKTPLNIAVLLVGAAAAPLGCAVHRPPPTRTTHSADDAVPGPQVADQASVPEFRSAVTSPPEARPAAESDGAPAAKAQTQPPVGTGGEGRGRESPGVTPERAVKTAPAAPAPPYTAPGPAFRQLAVVATAAVVEATSRQAGGTAADQAESLVFSAQGVAGRLGATAPPTRVAGAIVGRPGSVRGPATGLGFAATDNLFTPRVNPPPGGGGRGRGPVRGGSPGLGSRARPAGRR